MLYQLSYLATQSVPRVYRLWLPDVNTLAPARARIYPPPMSSACPFCDLPADRILAVDGPCLAFRDGFPVSAGHTLVIPRRHVASFRDLTPDEWAAAHRLARKLAADLQAADPAITGFNFGANDGTDAGQSVFHCHLHLIPRRAGDHPAPRGGIRGVIPGKAPY